MTVYAILAWNTGITVGPDGFRLGRAYWSKKVAWVDVDHFDVFPLGRFPFVGYAVLRDGRKLVTSTVPAYYRATEKNRARAQRRVDWLNARLNETRIAP